MCIHACHNPFRNSRILEISHLLNPSSHFCTINSPLELTLDFDTALPGDPIHAAMYCSVLDKPALRAGDTLTEFWTPRDTDRFVAQWLCPLHCYPHILAKPGKIILQIQKLFPMKMWGRDKSHFTFQICLRLKSSSFLSSIFSFSE